MPFQYANEANPRAHYEGTGAEIAEALDRVDVLVAGLGTGGTLMGTGERLRESFPDVVVAAAEPLPGDPVMGLRSLEDGYVPPILDVSKLDRKLLVSNAESVAGLRALLDREGIFAGVSAGAVVHVARRLAEEADEGAVVVCILADAGWKYLSADFWDARRPGSLDGERPLVVVPAAVRRALEAHAERGGSERSLRAHRASGTASPSATSRPRTTAASPYRFELPPPIPDGLLPRGRGLRARRLPLAPHRQGRAVAHRRREHRALGGQAVPDPVAPDRRAPRLAHPDGRAEELELA